MPDTAPDDTEGNLYYFTVYYNNYLLTIKNGLL